MFVVQRCDGDCPRLYHLHQGDIFSISPDIVCQFPSDKIQIIGYVRRRLYIPRKWWHFWRWCITPKSVKVMWVGNDENELFI